MDLRRRARLRSFQRDNSIDLILIEGGQQASLLLWLTAVCGFSVFYASPALNRF